MRNNYNVATLVREMREQERREQERREQERRERRDVEALFGMIDAVSYLTARGVDVHGRVLA